MSTLWVRVRFLHPKQRRRGLRTSFSYLPKMRRNFPGGYFSTELLVGGCCKLCSMLQTSNSNTVLSLENWDAESMCVCKFTFVYMYVYMPVCTSVYVYTCHLCMPMCIHVYLFVFEYVCVFQGLWRREEDAWSLGAVVTSGCEPLVWVLGIQHRSSEKAASALCHRAISPVPRAYVLLNKISIKLFALCRILLKNKRPSCKLVENTWKGHMIKTCLFSLPEEGFL